MPRSTQLKTLCAGAGVVAFASATALPVAAETVTHRTTVTDEVTVAADPAEDAMIVPETPAYREGHARIVHRNGVEEGVDWVDVPPPDAPPAPPEAEFDPD